MVAEDQHRHAARATIPIALGSYRLRPHLPRFRALARLRRRPPERLVRSVAEASENAAQDRTHAGARTLPFTQPLSEFGVDKCRILAQLPETVDWT
jgi:hypothetical protein